MYVEKAIKLILVPQSETLSKANSGCPVRDIIFVEKAVKLILNLIQRIRNLM